MMQDDINNDLQEDLILNISDYEEPTLICHQKEFEDNHALLTKIEFQSLEIFDVHSFGDITLVTDNNVRIDLSIYKDKYISGEKSVVLNLVNLPEFEAINLPNWLILKSAIYNNLRGIIKAKLLYKKISEPILIS